MGATVAMGQIMRERIFEGKKIILAEKSLFFSNNNNEFYSLDKNDGFVCIEDVMNVIVPTAQYKPASKLI